MNSSKSTSPEIDSNRNTATIAKRQGGGKNHWSTGALEQGSDAYFDPLLPILHHSNTPSLQYSIAPLLRASPLPRMKLTVNRFKARAIDMRINLRRRDIGVTQH